MTTIAWDGETLAADTQISAGDIIIGYAPKIWRAKDGALLGSTGSVAFEWALRAWWDGGGKNTPPDMGDDSGFVIQDGRVERVGSGQRYPAADSLHMAWGTGRELALAAMGCGATAEKAVAEAIKRCVWSGGEITVLRPA